MDERYIFEGTVVIGELRREEYVLLEPMENHDYIYGDLQLSAEIAAAGLRGIEPELYISLDRLEAFVQEFSAFEEKRSGSVTLTAMDPDEFALTFAVVHVAGDVEVHATMKRFSWVGRKCAPSSLDLRFAIDPASLPAVRDQFCALLAFQVPTDAS